MRYEHLQLMNKLLSLGSLRAVADEMHVTAPALTKSLHQLEDEMQTTLVMRSSSGVRLTRAGEVVANRASAALREMDMAKEEVAWLTREVAGSLSIACAVSPALQVLPHAIQHVRARWPTLTIRTVDAVFPQIFSLLKAGELDLGLGPRPAGPLEVGISSELLYQVDLVIIARTGHPLAQSTSIDQLEGAEWVYSGPTRGPGDPNRLGFKERGLRPATTSITCNSLSMVLPVLPYVDALALVPRVFFEANGKQYGLVEIPIEEDLPKRDVFAFWRTNTPLSLHAKHFLEAVYSVSKEIRGAA